MKVKGTNEKDGGETPKSKRAKGKRYRRWNSAAGEMTPAQAERDLGLKRSAYGRNLLRLVLQREAEIGKRIAVRHGPVGPGRRYGLTRTALRKHMPELFEDRFDKGVSSVRRMLERIESHIDERIDERIEQHPKIRELDDKAGQTLELVEELAGQVERVAKPG